MNAKKRIVLKLGSTTLTKGSRQISRGKLEDIAKQIIELKDDYEIVIVTSGAIAAARQYIQLHGGNPVAVKQALAAIGQPALMRLYSEVFADFGLQVGQCLLTYRDFENDLSRSNTIGTVDILLANGYTPIINENDTIATDEIKFGDNDKLAALVAVLLKADLLILASDIDGLFNADPSVHKEAALIERVDDIKKIEHLENGSISALGTGGIKSKIEAARICHAQNIETWIVNGRQDNFAVKAIKGEIAFTGFAVKESEG